MPARVPVTSQLVYHHRYRITVRLQRHKGYIPLKGIIEDWPVAYDSLVRNSQCQNQERNREERERERGVQLT